MSKIPADRYRAAGEIVAAATSQPHRLATQKDEWAKKLFGTEKGLREQQRGARGKDGGEKKVRKSVCYLFDFLFTSVCLKGAQGSCTEMGPI